METITFRGTEKQLYNLQDIYEQCEKDKPQEVETRVYVVEVKDGRHLHAKTDEEFMDLAEKEGNVYTLKGFQESFNLENINSATGVIRFINVTI